MKIQELIDVHENWTSGSLRLRYSGWNSGTFFTPHYFCELDKMWYGVNEDNESIQYSTLGSDWEVYTEPKKKVKYYQWMDKNTKQIVDVMYTEEDVANHSFSNYIKIPGIEVELEVEE